MSDHYILGGQDGHTPILADLMTWARAFEDHAARIVARDELPGDVFVSTVFLGIDHNFGVGPPLLFETMIFGGGLTGEHQERCSTWVQAEEQHAKAVAIAKARA